MFIPIGYLFGKKYKTVALKRELMYSVYEGLKENFILHAIHYMSFMTRRIVVVGIVCGLLGKFSAPLTLLIISHATYAIYTIVLRPYKEIFVNIFDFSCDVVVTIYYICLAAFK